MDISRFLCRALIKSRLLASPNGSLGGLHTLFYELPAWEWSFWAIGYAISSSLEVKLFQSSCSSSYTTAESSAVVKALASLRVSAKVTPNAARLPGPVLLTEYGSLIYFLVSVLMTSGSCVIHSLSISDDCLH